jgi:hypothetical protein
MRTAEGVNAFSAGIVERLQYFIEQFENLVYVPVLEAFVEMCNDHLSPDDINRILSEADGKAYEGDILEVYNATCSIDVLSSTKLAVRRAAAQLLPMLLQLVQAQPVQDSLVAQSRKFDYAELLDEALELGGWNINSLIVEMTEEDQKRSQQNPAAIKAMSDMQKMQMQQQNDLQKIEQTGIARAGVAVIKHSLAASDKAEAAGGILGQ